MEIAKTELLTDLEKRIENAFEAAAHLRKESTARLNFRESANAWSALECIEHLNRYGEFYIPEITKRMQAGPPQEESGLFKSGWLGNYFAKLMQGKNGHIRKLKSPSDKNPIHTVLSVSAIDHFTEQLQQTRELLNRARSIDITHTRTAISISKLVTLRLGDTFRFFIYHIERHLAQAKRAIEHATQAL